VQIKYFTNGQRRTTFAVPRSEEGGGVKGAKGSCQLDRLLWPVWALVSVWAKVTVRNANGTCRWGWTNNKGKYTGHRIRFLSLSLFPLCLSLSLSTILRVAGTAWSIVKINQSVLCCFWNFCLLFCYFVADVVSAGVPSVGGRRKFSLQQRQLVVA